MSAKINNQNDDDDDMQTSLRFSVAVCVCVLRKAVCKEVSFILLLLLFSSSGFSSNSIISVLEPTGRVDESETENDTLLSFIKAKYG
jgi:hypothetical protein